jgi:hypothetical protein
VQGEPVAALDKTSLLQVEMVGELETVADVITADVLEKAMQQGEGYAAKLGKKGGVVVRVLETSSGNLYEIVRK